MVERICSIEGCVKPVNARGWCSMHYKRWKLYGDLFYKAEPPQRICSVDGCGRKHKSRGYCAYHYQCEKLYGDPLTIPERPKRNICIIDDCERFVFGHGYCQRHYYHWRNNGDPLYRPPPVPLGYRSAHKKVARVRGKAKSHPCLYCDERAADWAYTHDDPDELVDEKKRVYSANPSFYIPLCDSCHVAFDARWRKGG